MNNSTRNCVLKLNYIRNGACIELSTAASWDAENDYLTES